jgi:GAF domain-containing protein
MDLREQAGQIRQEIDRAVSAGESPAAIAGVVVRRLRPLLGARRAVVTRFDLAAGDGEWLAVDAETPTTIGPGARFPLSMMGDVPALQRGQVQRIDVEGLADLPQRSALLAEGVHAFVVVPLMAGGRLVGSLNFGAGSAGQLTARHVEAAREVAARLAPAIARG